jgi:hypothetical protein
MSGEGGVLDLALDPDVAADDAGQRDAPDGF